LPGVDFSHPKQIPIEIATHLAWTS
jgi:hypothetical protein